MDDLQLATIAANIESHFNDLAEKDTDSPFSFDYGIEGSDSTYHCDLAILDVMSFKNEYGVEVFKAIAFVDPDGNIYIHYNGTGDGNWGYNDVAYGGGPSKVQTESLAFFDLIMKTYSEMYGGNVYVSGHSQGGNNAQYVTMMSEYGYRVDKCIAMDAPGFSEEAVESMKTLYGEDYYNSQRDKIHGYNGENDYVSPLGQENIIPQDKDHITIILTEEDDLMNRHMIDGMLDGTNLKPQTNEYGEFRQIVVALNEKIKDLPQDQQEDIAELVMILAEMFVGGEDNIVGINLGNFLDAFELLDAMLADLLVLAISSAVTTIVQTAKDFVSKAIQSITEYIQRYNPGVQYAANNPYFKADPEKLRSYATRLSNVNRRLVQLDRNLDSLYWQVGFDDLWAIVGANLITSYSANLGLAQTFLNTAAEKLEDAERRALSHMGG